MTSSDRGPDDDEALKARLERLKGSLEERRRREPPRRENDEASALGTSRALSMGLRVLSEFTAGIIVGAGIGWLLDKWLSTPPAFLIVFLAVGTATGFWNVYRMAAGSTGDRRNGSN